MTNQEKILVFKNELDYIHTESVRLLVEKALSNVNDKFFISPASSGGNYHPKFANAHAGLIKHTQAVVWIIQQVMQLEHVVINDNFTKEYNSDILIASAILHDSCKSGINWDSKYTVHEHPILVRSLLNEDDLSDTEKLDWNRISSTISSHMGEWCENKYSNIILPKPTSEAQKLLHLADYVASRKEFFLTIFEKLHEE